MPAKGQTMSILISSRYRPARGGHAPGDIRDAFLVALEELRGWAPGTAEPTAEVRERQVPLSVLCGLLWNCTDTLPSLDGQEVWAFVEQHGAGYEAGRRASCSYGRAARALRAVFAADGRRQAA
jgi:hypothetical protein